MTTVWIYNQPHHVADDGVPIPILRNGALLACFGDELQAGDVYVHFAKNCWNVHEAMRAGDICELFPISRVDGARKESSHADAADSAPTGA